MPPSQKEKEKKPAERTETKGDARSARSEVPGESEPTPRPALLPPPLGRTAAPSLAHPGRTQPREPERPQVRPPHCAVPVRPRLPTRGRCATAAAHPLPSARRLRGGPRALPWKPLIGWHSDKTFRAPRELTLCVPFFFFLLRRQGREQ